MPLDFKKLYKKTLAEKKALKKENQKLKESMKDTVCASVYNNILGEIADYSAENEELKEENQELKEEQFDNMEELAKHEGMCLVDIQIFDRLIDSEKENEELKKEIRHLEDRAVADYDCHMNQYKELKEKNEILKKKLEIQEWNTGLTDTRILYEHEDWYKKEDITEIIFN